ncbi:MAG TPA: M1 family metallopeptidase [Chitinophagaceae bacterium]|nr:M1 family metallopeptidase [Chitinophagaceae bacterium]
MRKIILLILVATGLAAEAQKLASGGPLKPEQANMDIRHYTLSLDVVPETSSYSGFTEIDLILANGAPVILFDLDNAFTVTRVNVNGKPKTFDHKDGLLRINSDPAFPAGKQKVKIEYGGKPHVAVRPPWDGGIQWSKDSLGRWWIAQSCQEDGADLFFPCKDHPSDEPNEGADMFITVPKGMVVAGPGILQKVSSKGKKSTYHWKTNYTISNYCILFNAGSYAVEKRTYTSVDGNKIPMEYYVLDYNKHRASYHLDLLERSTKMLEKYFGEYPWAKEKIGIAETPHLGMEHQTMNAYGNQYRYSKVGSVDFDWLLHHEFGHEWWANKVSNKDWADMWIQEGICSFGDHLFTEDFGGREAYLKRFRQTAVSTQNKLPIVQGEVVDSRQAYHGDIYGKGALFMHTLRYVLGDEVFFPALRSFATDPKYTYDNLVVTGDVLKHFNAASGKDLAPLFKLFIYSTDKLWISVKQVTGNSYTLKLDNLDMTIPVEVQTSSGVKKLMLSKKPVSLQSETMPIVDADGYYLKKVSYE